MKPYYCEDGVTIYWGDCREILTEVSADALITDPPYGVDLGVSNNQAEDSTHLHKSSYLSYEDSYENFVAVVVPSLSIGLSRVKCGAVFTGPHIHEQRKPTAIGGVWHPSAVGRTPWGSKNFLPVLFYGNPPNAGRHRPTVISSTAISEVNGHPCPKPIEWLYWLVELSCRVGGMVLDPFMGSGTTLVAAKNLGRQAIGIEIEERYCEIAARRLQQEALPLEVA